MTEPWTKAIAPDLDTFDKMARSALEHIPPPFNKLAQDVVLRVADFAADEVLMDLGIDDPFGLTGLYDGLPLTQKSALDQPLAPDIIWLFRRAILDEWIARGDVLLGDLVAHVVVHELAHHFGWSDEDIAQIDKWWE